MQLCLAFLCFILNCLWKLLLPRKNHRNVWTNNTSFFKGNFFNGIPEPIDMIQTNIGNHGNIRFNNIDHV